MHMVLWLLLPLSKVSKRLHFRKSESFSGGSIEVAGTVSDPVDGDEELRYLYGILIFVS